MLLHGKRRHATLFLSIFKKPKELGRRKHLALFFMSELRITLENFEKISSRKTPVSKLPLPQRFQDINGYFCVKILFVISLVEFVYSCYVCEAFPPLFRFRITCEIFCHFLQLCPAKTADPPRRCLRSTSVLTSIMK